MGAKPPVGFTRFAAAATRAARKAADEEPGARIEEIRSESNGVYGVRRITRELGERHGTAFHRRTATIAERHYRGHYEFDLSNPPPPQARCRARRARRRVAEGD